MMRAVVVTLALAGCVRADRWSAGDTFVQTGVGMTMAADLVQTRQIVRAPRPGHIESNPLMRPGGVEIPPEVYFPVAFAAHTAIAAMLPRTWLRRIWQGVTIAVQLEAIDTNLSAGYQLAW